MRVRFLTGGNAGREINLPYRAAMASIRSGTAEQIEEAVSRPIPAPTIKAKSQESLQKQKRERR
jgi:hypothetical protein